MFWGPCPECFVFCGHKPKQTTPDHAAGVWAQVTWWPLLPRISLLHFLFFKKNLKNRASKKKRCLFPHSMSTTADGIDWGFLTAGFIF